MARRSRSPTEKTNSAMEDTLSRAGTPEPPTAVFPDWVTLDRFGRAICHSDRAAAREAVKNETTAVKFRTASGLSGYFSFTLAVPPKVSYLDLHWNSALPAYSSVLGADENLLLLRIAVPSDPNCHFSASDDLLVYEAGPSPSLLRLPPCTTTGRGVGLLGLADRYYLVADLVSAARKGSRRNEHSGNGDPFVAKLRVYSSKTRKWQVIKKTAPQPHGKFPISCSTHGVFPFDARFLCWVDYFGGVLLCDFSETSSPALHFAPFPGKQYADEAPASRCFPDRFRSVSVSRGMMRFVHIDNDWHESVCTDDNDYWVGNDWSGRSKERPPPKPGSKITVWTLNMTHGDFKWEVHRVINLDCLWAHCSYQDQGIPQRLPEFPIFNADDPDSLCCLLREEEFRGNAWMIVVDMEHARLRSCTRYVNEKISYIHDMYVEARKKRFCNVPLLPAVFSKYLCNKPSGILGATHKFATRSSKKRKISI